MSDTETAVELSSAPANSLDGSRGVASLVQLLRLIEFFQTEDASINDAARKFGRRPAKIRSLLEQWGTLAHGSGDGLDSVTINLPLSNDEPVWIERDLGATQVLQPSQAEAAIAFAACISATSQVEPELAQRLQSLQEKLAIALAVPTHGLEISAPELLPRIRATIAAQQRALMQYQPLDRPSTNYVLTPRELFSQANTWYLWAWVEDRGWRKFRLDRIRNWQQLQQTDRNDYGEPDRGTPKWTVEFLLPWQAHWILDEFPWAQTERVCEPGDDLQAPSAPVALEAAPYLRVAVPVFDPAWWAQMWLQYGDLFTLTQISPQLHKQALKARRAAVAVALQAAQASGTTLADCSCTVQSNTAKNRIG